MTNNEVQAFQDIFVKKLKILLDKNNITQRELAETIGISESTVGKWLLKKAIPRMGIIEKLSSVFSVPKSYFFDEKENRQSYYLDDNVAKIAKSLSKDEISLIEDFRNLNKKGQRIASDAVKSFTLNPDFTICPQESAARGKGA